MLSLILGVNWDAVASPPLSFGRCLTSVSVPVTSVSRAHRQPLFSSFSVVSHALTKSLGFVGAVQVAPAGLSVKPRTLEPVEHPFDFFRLVADGNGESRQVRTTARPVISARCAAFVARGGRWASPQVPLEFE